MKAVADVTDIKRIAPDPALRAAIRAEVHAATLGLSPLVGPGLQLTPAEGQARVFLRVVRAFGFHNPEWRKLRFLPHCPMANYLRAAIMAELESSWQRNTLRLENYR